MIQYLGTAIYKCSAESFSKKYKKLKRSTSAKSLFYRIPLGEFNPFEPSVAFHIETNYLFCFAKRITDFYIKHNTELK